MFKDRATRRATLLGFILVFLTLCCCGVTVAGWLRGGFDAILRGAFDQEAHSEVSVPIEGPLVLDLEHGVGNLVIQGDETDEIRVNVTARSETVEQAQAVAATLTAEGQEVTLSLSGVDEGEVAVDLTIHTPPQTELHLHSQAGTIDIVGLQGPMELQHSRGRIRVLDHAADGQLTIEGGSSNVSVTLVTIEEGTEVRLTSVAGDVRVTLPDNVGFALDAATDAGTVQIDGYTLVNQTAEDEGSGDHLIGEIEPMDDRAVWIEVGVGNVFVEAR